VAAAAAVAGRAAGSTQEQIVLVITRTGYEAAALVIPFVVQFWGCTGVE
jgi:hypothetical protein